MTGFATICLFIGAWLAALVIAKYIDWPRATIFTLKKKVKPEDVRTYGEPLTPAMLERYRHELYRNRPVTVHTAMKQKPSGIKASVQRGNFQ